MLDGDIYLTGLMRSMHWMAICRNALLRRSWEAQLEGGAECCNGSLPLGMHSRLLQVATAIASKLVALPQLDMRPRGRRTKEILPVPIPPAPFLLATSHMQAPQDRQGGTLCKQLQLTVC